MRGVGSCSVEGCDRALECRGLCCRHYYRLRTYGHPLAEGPNNPDRGPVCTIDGCERKHNAKGMCATHYNRVLRYGDPHRKVRASPGEGTLTVHGYRILKRPYHPNADKNGSIFEHRVVMSQMLRRPLLPGENVHHINGVKDDNRPENLQLWVSMQPTGQRPEEMVAWATEIFRRYAPERLAEEA